MVAPCACSDAMSRYSVRRLIAELRRERRAAHRPAVAAQDLHQREQAFGTGHGVHCCRGAATGQAQMLSLSFAVASTTPTPCPASPAPGPAARRSTRSTGSVTLADVAKLAGVSPITVSRVVNRPELVTADTLAHVQQMHRAHGLRAQPPGRRTGLQAHAGSWRRSCRRSPTPIFVDTVQALTDRLWEAGYQVLLGLSGYPATREDALLGAVLSRRPDAIYLTGINHSPEVRQRLINAKIPVVETWDMTPTPIDMLVGFSHEKVGEAVARHLLARGHRRFGMIWADDARALARQRGFLAELAANGCPDVEVVDRAGAVDADARARRVSRGCSSAARGRPRCSAAPTSSPTARSRRPARAASPSRTTSRSSASATSSSPSTPFPRSPRCASTGRPSAAGRPSSSSPASRRTTPAEKVVDVGFTIVDRGTT